VGGGPAGSFERRKGSNIIKQRSRIYDLDAGAVVRFFLSRVFSKLDRWFATQPNH
jgi:hypothetical protein